MINTAEKHNPEQPGRDTIERILREESRFFRAYHRRAPIGRESEDVVDNAFSRLRKYPNLSYVQVADIYGEMRCKRA